MALQPKTMFVATRTNHQVIYKRGGVEYVPQTGREIETLPEMIEFGPSNTYVTSDPEKIEFLRSRVEADPQSLREIPVPTSDPSGLLSEITDLAIQGDGAALARILKTEEEGEQREIVMSTVRNALESLKARGELTTNPPGRPRKAE